MKRSPHAHRQIRAAIETLETRVLLAHIGLDPSFAGGGGAAVAGSGFLRDLSGGKILAVGGDSATRLNDDGSIDSTFTDAGAAPGTRDAERAVISGNRLIIAGRVTGTQSFVIRALSLDTGAGAVDTTFGTNGSITLTPPAFAANTTINDTNLPSMIVTSDGEILISVTQSLHVNSGAPSGTPITADAFYKLTAAGQLDSSFGNAGVDIFNSGANGASAQLVTLAGGKFLDLRSTGSHTATIERRLNDGTLDTTFGANGHADLTIGAAFPSYGGPVVQSDGKILYSVTDIGDLSSTGRVARLNADGTRDETFGTVSGTTLIPGSGSVGQLTLDSEGRIVGIFRPRAASGDDGDDTQADVFRMSADGVLDTSFDDDGIARVRDLTSITVTTDASDRILVASSGSVFPSSGVAGDITRYIPQESVAIDADGIVQINGTGNADVVTATLSAATITVTFNGQSTNFSAADVTAFNVNVYDGDDSVDLSALNLPATIHGGDGNDLLVTGAGSQSLYGDANKDTLFAGAGGDLLSGGGGNDALAGETGRDRLYGGDGRDHLYGGGGDDQLFGGAAGDWLYSQNGNDNLSGEGGLDRLYSDYESGSATLHGGAGNDLFVSKNALADHLFGDSGNDTSIAGPTDLLTSIESAM